MAGPSHLKPGEKGRIIARIGNLPVQGNVTERIEVVSNDPKRAKVILILQAQVAAPLPLPSLVPRLDEHPRDPVIRK
jgi:hypothetical protein